MRPSGKWGLTLLLSLQRYLLLGGAIGGNLPEFDGSEINVFTALDGQFFAFQISEAESIAPARAA